MAIIGAMFHFYFFTYDAVNTICRTLGATTPDPEDQLHQRLINIIEEIQIFLGNKQKITGVVIPSLAMNGLSALDYRGNSLITITEGLLSRLSREQTEAVIAHEAYHILSGDCLEHTMAVSLLGLPASLLEKIALYGERRFQLSPIYILAFIIVKLSVLLNIFISREREYRADAGAVRMNRNPLALAQVLYLLSRNWRGTGLIGSGLETLCIVNPRISQLDESEGIKASLFSTHPPIQKRIQILLTMAHASLAELQTKSITEEKTLSTDAPPSKEYWNWNHASNYLCPQCSSPLFPQTYEKTKIFRCRACAGTLVESDKIIRIIARQDNRWNARIKALARQTLKENQIKYITAKMKKEEKNIPLLHCPKCNHPMSRTFYSCAYLVIIDRCYVCKLTWFAPQELELLQCMIDNSMASDL
ncbi:MAG: zinc metalloprotease HtpX [Desulfobacterota bacterium]|nr:zinc metalloprotease HtpX [Thermodesulfobacteriota bacterium]